MSRILPLTIMTHLRSRNGQHRQNIRRQRYLEQKQERRQMFHDAYRDREIQEIVSRSYYYLTDIRQGEVVIDPRGEGSLQILKIHTRRR